MELRESLRIGWRAIRGHKLRSVLTTLGIVIGIAAVITFVTLGASLEADIIETVAGDNTDIIYVTAESGGDDGIPRPQSGGEFVFTARDVQNLEGVRGTEAVVPESGLAAERVIHRNGSVGRQLVTITEPSYFRAKGLTMEEGRSFRMAENEVVLNKQAAQMFEENVSVGDQIVIVRAATGQPINATVVGIVSDQSGGDSGSSVYSRPSRPAIYAPPDPYYDRTVISPKTDERQPVYNRILIKVEDVQKIDTVEGRIHNYLGSRSDARVLKSDQASFKVTTYEQLVSQIQQVSNTFTAYISGIALISLLVGTIGIANIMLVSVTERTREIGVMKAVGARNRDVLQVFLIEATLLGIIGSVLGSVVGILGGYLGTEFIGLPYRLKPMWLLISVVTGIVVGVAAGLYPAWEAAKVDPIDALRHE